MCRCNFILKLIVILISFESVKCLNSRRCLACTPITLLPCSFKEIKLPLDSHEQTVWSTKEFPLSLSPAALSLSVASQLTGTLGSCPQRDGQGVQSRSCSAHPAESWYVVSCHFLMYLPKGNNFSLGKWCRPGTEDWAWSGPTCSCGGPGCLCSPVAAHCPSKHAQRSGDQWLVSGSDMQGHCWSGWSQVCTQWWGPAWKGTSRLMSCTHAIAKDWAGCWCGFWDLVGFRRDSSG